MEAIRLTKEHTTKLLKMCTRLFPELGSAQLGVKEEHGWSNDYLVFGIEKPDNETFVIHWFEFCMTHLQDKIRKMFIPEKSNSDEEYFTFTLEDILENHLIDYLYKEFEFYKKKITS